MSDNKWVYAFGPKNCDGDASMRNLLGGKGANLAEMASIGLPVPPGFTITTEVCTYYYDNNETYPQELKQQVLDCLKEIEQQTNLITLSLCYVLQPTCNSFYNIQYPIYSSYCHYVGSYKLI